MWKPKRLAGVHCPGHQKPVDPVSRGNHFADQTAKRIALSPAQAMAVQLPDPGPRDLPPVAEYAEEDWQWVEKLPIAQLLEEWWRDSKCRTVLPEKLGEEVLQSPRWHSPRRQKAAGLNPAGCTEGKRGCQRERAHCSRTQGLPAHHRGKKFPKFWSKTARR